MKEPRSIQADRKISIQTPTDGQFLKVADAVWVAAAMLQMEQPQRDREGFQIEEIAKRVLREELTHAQVQSIYQHVRQHCVANRKPDPGRSRILFAIGQNRRLWRPGDAYDPAREGAPNKPKYLPPEFSNLIDWYEEWAKLAMSEPEDPLLSLVGTGTHIWKSEHADAHVKKLREGWE